MSTSLVRAAPVIDCYCRVSVAISSHNQRHDLHFSSGKVSCFRGDFRSQLSHNLPWAAHRVNVIHQEAKSDRTLDSIALATTLVMTDHAQHRVKVIPETTTGFWVKFDSTINRLDFVRIVDQKLMSSFRIALPGCNMK